MALKHPLAYVKLFHFSHLQVLLYELSINNAYLGRLLNSNALHLSVVGSLDQCQVLTHHLVHRLLQHVQQIEAELRQTEQGPHTAVGGAVHQLLVMEVLQHAQALSKFEAREVEVCLDQVLELVVKNYLRVLEHLDIF